MLTKQLHGCGEDRGMKSDIAGVRCLRKIERVACEDSCRCRSGPELHRSLVTGVTMVKTRTVLVVSCLANWL